MNLKDELRERGASEVQLTSKTLSMVEDILAEASGDEVKEMGMECLRDAVADATKAISTIDNKRRSLEWSIGKADEVAKRLSASSQVVILDDDNSQAVELFRKTLCAVKEVFGDSLSDEVMTTAIQAASYGMWRSIMGESKPNYSPRRER